MKTVFKSNEIAHIWANASAAHGRSPGNLSFHGDAIKSYATVIGRRMQANGKTAYVLDRASFSVSTSKSQGRVWQAIPDSEKVFRINQGQRGQSLLFTPVELAKHFEMSADNIAQEMPSRYAFKRAEQYANVTTELEKARDVLAFFGLGTVRLDKELAKRAAGAKDAESILAEYRARLIHQEKTKEARELKERTARVLSQALEFLADEKPATRWIDTLEPHRASAFALLPADVQAKVADKVNASNASLVTRWRAGKDVNLPHDCATMLRAEGDEMVTSRGARVPLTDAKRSYRFILLAKAKGWHRNGEVHQIGGYHIDAVNEQGVVAGCHHVNWSEIEHFASSQGWVK